MAYSLPDLAAVRAILRSACDSSTPLDGLEATYVQAGVDGAARVLYETRSANGDVLRVAARRMSSTKGRQIEAAINARSPWPHPSTGFMRAALYAPALDLLFHVFPADEDLPSLPIAVDGSAMAAVLHHVLAAPGAHARLQSVAVQVVRYKPGRKCLLRYDLTWAGDDRTNLRPVVWARVARRSKFERTRSILPCLHAAAVDIGFDLPQPLGVVPELAMELLGPVAGVVIFADVHRHDFPLICRRTGEGLRRFHALPVEVEERFDIEAQVERLTENAREFAWMLPGDAKRITEIECEIARRLRAGATSRPTLIHRDFHGDNILVSDGGRLALLDFEDCAMGDPADDVGSNWAQLTWHAQKAGSQQAGLAAARRAFVDGYLDLAEAAMASRLPTYAALHCFLFAHQCLRHLRDAGRHDDALAMLTASEDALERGLK